MFRRAAILALVCGLLFVGVPPSSGAAAQPEIVVHTMPGEELASSQPLFRGTVFGLGGSIEVRAAIRSTASGSWVRPDGSLSRDAHWFEAPLFVGSTNRWSFRPPSLSDGEYEFAAVATDVAGHEISLNPHLAFVIDSNRVTDVREVEQLGGWLYFVGSTPTTGVELWRTDGSATDLVADIWPGESGSYPLGLVRYRGWLYFSASDGIHGAELWRTNGRVTELAVDVNPGPAGSLLRSATVYRGELFFGAVRDDVGAELWSTDGRDVTLRVDLSPDDGWSFARPVATFGGWLYFTGNTPDHGTEVFRYRNGRVELVSSGGGFGFEQLGGWLYFTAGSAEFGVELFRTKGRVTELAFDVNPEPTADDCVSSRPQCPGHSWPVWHTTVAGWLYFGAFTPEAGYEMMRTDGSTLELVTDMSDRDTFRGSALTYPAFLEAHRSWVYFTGHQNDSGRTRAGVSLWRTDGSAVEQVSPLETSILESAGGQLYAVGGMERSLWLVGTEIAQVP